MTEVVAALIWKNNKFMICQRPAHKARGLLWEFVGGKVEPGESKEQALIRECNEELAVTLSVGDIFMDVVHEYPDLTVHLTLFNATIAEGKPQKLEHNDIKWITPSEIPFFEFCPADKDILIKISEQRKPTTQKCIIEKLVYKRDFFDVSQMASGAKLVTTITADGSVMFREYVPNSRKVQSFYKGRCSIEAYRLLCDRLEDCISLANRIDFYDDDASEELKMFYRFGRIQIVDRGLGYEEIHIGDIMHDFFEKDVELING